jgi:hypothetical protein
MFLNNNNESLRLYKGHALSLLETAFPRLTLAGFIGKAITKLL